jgi:SAM-dependent methyltransferase
VPVACVLCGEARLQALLHAYDRKHKPPRWDYHVVRCAGCGLLFRHPGIRPERLGDLYSSGSYARFLAGKYTRKRIRRYRVTMAPFGPLFRTGRGRRLLDFGCGNGLFLDVAYRRGFDCYGVDLAADAIAVARQKPSGQHTYHGNPTEFRSWQPVASTSSRCGQSWRISRSRSTWGGFTANHLAFFAPDTLSLLLRRAGSGRW